MNKGMLNKKKKSKIIELRKQGESMAKIAKLTRVSVGAVWNIIHNYEEIEDNQNKPIETKKRHSGPPDLPLYTPKSFIPGYERDQRQPFELMRNQEESRIARLEDELRRRDEQEIRNMEQKLQELEQELKNPQQRQEDPQLREIKLELARLRDENKKITEQYSRERELHIHKQLEELKEAVYHNRGLTEEQVIRLIDTRVREKMKMVYAGRELEQKKHQIPDWLEQHRHVYYFDHLLSMYRQKYSRKYIENWIEEHE